MTDTDHRHHVLLSTALAVLLVASAGVAAAQTADETSGPFAEDGPLSSALAAADGAVERGIDWASYRVRALLGDSLDAVEAPPTAEDRADELQQWVNDRNETLTTYANEVILADTDANLTEPRVAEVQLTGPEGDTATRFVVISVAGGEVASIEAVNSTDLAANVTIELSGYATSEAQATAERLYQQYVLTDRRPEASERSRLTTKFGASVRINGERLPSDTEG